MTFSLNGTAGASSWTETTIDQVCEPAQYGFTASAESLPVGPRMLRITDIQPGGVDWDAVPFCQCSEPEKYLLQPGDILFARTGATTGKSYLVKECPNSVFASYLIRLRPKEMILPEFLYWFFQSPQYWEQITEQKRGTGQPGVNASKLGKLVVKFPPREEQRRIVARIEELMERSQRARGALLAVEKEQPKLRMAALFQAFHPNEEMDSVRVEGLGSSRLTKEYDLWPLPKGWRWTSFADVALVASNLVDPGQHASSPHIAPNHIESDTGRLLSYQTAAEDGVTSLKHLFQPGDILYSKIRPYLNKVCVVDFEGICSADMYPIRTSLYTTYLLYWMLSPHFVRWAAGNQGRTVLPKINQAALASIPVPVPPMETQVEIAEKLHLILQSLGEQEVQAVKAKDTLVVLESTILHEAFTGTR